MLLYHLSLGSCNHFFEPNGEIIEGEVDSWRDYEDGDQIQVIIDGVTYLVHAANTVLMTENKEELHGGRS